MPTYAEWLEVRHPDAMEVFYTLNLDVGEGQESDILELNVSNANLFAW